WKEIQKGNNILIASPRRVGKTSVMKYLTEHPKTGYKLVFRNVQGIDDETQFYKAIYELIILCLSKFRSNKAMITSYFAQNKISEISSTGFKIESKGINYLLEINKLIPQLDAKGESIVLLIDELPEVLHNLFKKDKKDVALGILKNLRHWRQEDGFKKIQFVLAGSIGIHYVVSLIGGRTSDINDLNKIYYRPLDDGEFGNYIKWVTDDATIQYNSELQAYLKMKIKYFVPYFINLIIDEIDSSCQRNNRLVIEEKDIDDAFLRIIKHNDHFSDWKKRLSDYMPEKDFCFVNEILAHIAHKHKISIQEIYDKATKYEKTLEYMELISDLEQDGYIVEHDDKYIFISPFLKEYWKRTNPIYHE
ncbi:MAG: hypothetical protein PHE56_03170, partial [Bacteroidales bacterium]|nr:hypothetical protein [Bacteroidales bacterium]